MLKRFAPTATTLALMLFVANCGSDSKPTDTGGTVSGDPTFAVDVLPILTANCVKLGCHDATASAGLEMSSGVAYANLVGVLSSEDNSKQRVAPGDAENSYIVMKLEGRQTAGERMPRGMAPLSATQIQTIRDWIDAGALDN